MPEFIAKWVVSISVSFFLLLSIASRVSSSLPSKLPHVFPLSTNLFFPSFSWRFLLLTFPSLPSSPLTLTPLFPLLLTLHSRLPLTPSQAILSLPRSGKVPERFVVDSLSFESLNLFQDYLKMEPFPSEKKKVDGLIVYERRMKRSVFYNATDEKNRTIGDDGSYYVCVLCEDGGDLICCDSCPNTFHLECLKYESIPEGEWNCPNCQEAESLKNLKICKKARSSKKLKRSSHSSHSKSK